MSISEQFLGDGPIPGSSFTEELGTAAWQKPPRIASPLEAFQDFLRVLDEEDNYEMLVFCMEEGLPIEGIANTIVNNMVGGGIINYDVGLLMTPEIIRVLEAVAKKAEIDYVMEIPRKVDTRFVEAQIEKIEREESDKPKEEPEEDKEEPEKDKEEKPKRKGLMGG